MNPPAGTDAHLPPSAAPVLVAATEPHLAALMRWFPDARSCAVWGGPAFRFPFDPESFREDAHWGEMPSRAIVGPDGALLAFGQWYLRSGRCNLARLAVSPARRRAGLGTLLVRRLAAEGCRRLAVEECSLFVASANEPAAALYRKLGFVDSELPDGDVAPAGALYMVARVVELRLR